MGGFDDLFKDLLKPVTTVLNFFVKFFKSLPKLITNLVNALVYFVVNFIPLVFKGLKNLGVAIQTAFHYVTNPLELVEVFVRLLIFIPIMIVSILYHMPINKHMRIGDFIVYFSIKWLVHACFMFATALWCSYSLVFEYLAMRNVDKLTKGMLSTFYYRNILALENPPDAWYSVPNHQFDNKNARYFLAYKPCPSGLKPNGVFCTKKEYYENDYCDESKIYKLSLGDDVKLGNNNLNQTSQSFLKLSSHEKEEVIDDYVTSMRTNTEACKKKLSTKYDLIRSTCLENNDATSRKMESLCKKVFCKDNLDSMCHKYINVKNESSNDSKVSGYFEIIVQIIIILVTVLLIVTRTWK